MFFNKILLAVDNSEQSARAVEMVKRMSKASLLKTIVLFNAYDSGSVDVTKLHSAQKLDELREASTVLLENYVAQLSEAGVTCQVKKAGGDAAPLIIDIVENDPEYDLIIVGSRKLNKFKEITMGSVSDKVTRLVSIPVLVIK